MGYSTEFEGGFPFDKEPSIAVLERLSKLNKTDTRDLDDGVKYPGAHCQWRPYCLNDKWFIKWDGGEKFYDYEEWLQWIIDEVLKPAGLKISGQVTWQGDDISDRGYLVVEDEKVSRKTMAVVGDELQELKNFRDWVLNRSDWGDEIRDAWLEYNE
jgi:hypothetical protein